MDEYSWQLLRVAVAQICQTIGWEATHPSAINYLTDLLEHYLREIAYRSNRYAEHCGRTIGLPGDVGMAFRDLNISIGQLMEYIDNVEAVPSVMEVPQYPVRRESNLNFLKPGSKEVITRPVHIHEHLPPIYPEQEEGDDSALGGKAEQTSAQDNQIDPASVIRDITNTSAASRESSGVPSKPDIAEIAQTLRRPRLGQEEESGRATREISSVMMTSGGFISPATEGKLPDAMIPIIREPSPPRPPTPPRPITPPVAPPPLAIPPTTPVATQPASSSSVTTPTTGPVPMDVLTPPPAPRSKSEKRQKKQKNANSTPTTAEAKEQRKRERYLAKLQKKRNAAAVAAGLTPDASPIAQQPIVTTPKRSTPAKRSRTKEPKASRQTTTHINVGEDGSFGAALLSPMSHSKKLADAVLPPVSLPADLTIKSETVLVDSSPPQQASSSFSAYGTAIATPPSQMEMPLSRTMFGSLEIMPMGVDDVKLTSELDKQKHSIFKKISKKSREAEAGGSGGGGSGSGAIPKDRDKPPTPGAGLFMPPGRGPLTISLTSESSSPASRGGAGENAFQRDVYNCFPALPQSTTIRRVPAKRPRTDPNVIVVDDDDDYGSPSMRRMASPPYPLAPNSTNRGKSSGLPSPYAHFMAAVSPNTSTPPATTKKQQRKPRGSRRAVIEMLCAEQSSPLNLSAAAARLGNYRPKKPPPKAGRRSKRASNANTAVPMLPPGMMGDMMPNVFGSAATANDSKLGQMPGTPGGGMDFGKMDDMSSSLHMFKDNPLVSSLPRFPLLNPFHLLTGPGLIPTNFMGSPANPLLTFPFGYSDFMGLRPTKVDEPRVSPPPTLPPELQTNVYCNVPPLVPESLKSQLKETTTNSHTSSATGGAGGGGRHHAKERPSATATSTTQSKALDTPIEISDDEKSNQSRSATTVEPTAPPASSGQSGTKFHDPVAVSTMRAAETAANRSDDDDDKSADEYGALTIMEDRDDDGPTTGLSPSAVKSPGDADHYSPSAATKSDKKRDKEHKKGKRGKDGKIKKKKDKKDKSKSKEKKEKDRSKKKKEKRKDKHLRTLSDHMPEHSSDHEGSIAGLPPIRVASKLVIQTGSDSVGSPLAGPATQHLVDHPSPGGVPKLTLKFGSPRSVASGGTSGMDEIAAEFKRGSSSKSTAGGGDELAELSAFNASIGDEQRDSSPELARISPLVTRPPKQKPRDSKTGDLDQSVDVQSTTAAAGTQSAVSSGTSTVGVVASRGPGRPPKNQQSLLIDADGNQVWICPACGRVDDGTPMIGCDGCDAWYHWVCVGIQVPPDEREDWYCRVCLAKKQEANGSDKKKKRKKKNKTNN